MTLSLTDGLIAPLGACRGEVSQGSQHVNTESGRGTHTAPHGDTTPSIRPMCVALGHHSSIKSLLGVRRNVQETNLKTAPWKGTIL